MKGLYRNRSLTVCESSASLLLLLIAPWYHTGFYDQRFVESFWKPFFHINPKNLSQRKPLFLVLPRILHIVNELFPLNPLWSTFAVNWRIRKAVASTPTVEWLSFHIFYTETMQEITGNSQDIFYLKWYIRRDFFWGI